VSDDEAKELGLQAAAWGDWRWMPGAVAEWPPLCGPGTQDIRTTSARVCEMRMGPLPTEYGIIDARDVRASAWPDLRDAATMGAALALWQAQPGHVFRVPCPVLTNAAAYGLTDPRTIRALVDATQAAP
jgi:hypothetical protein